MDAAIWGFIGVLVGALASIITTVIAVRHSVKIQRLSASEDRIQRHREFQLETLLSMQHAITDLMRSVSMGYVEYLKMYNDGIEWGQGMLGEEIDNHIRTSMSKLSLLRERVVEESIRSKVEIVLDIAGKVIFSDSPAEAQDNIYEAADRVGDLMTLIGSILRGLYYVAGVD